MQIDPPEEGLTGLPGKTETQHVAPWGPECPHSTVKSTQPTEQEEPNVTPELAEVAPSLSLLVIVCGYQ